VTAIDVAERQEILRTIRDFVDKDVLPNVSRYDEADEFPYPLVETMRELGLFGTTIPEEYGGLGLDLTTYALIVKELSRGWISLSGVINTHFIASFMIKTFGTEEQKDELLPAMARGDVRCAFSMTEPHAGSDVQAIRTRAVRDGEDYVVTGQKMWVTNGLRAGLVMLLAVTDPDATPRHSGMTAFIVRKDPEDADLPGLTIPPPLRKLGYKGVESTELVFDGFRVPAANVLGGESRVQVRPHLAADLEHVLEPRGGEQDDARATPLEERVRRHRRAVVQADAAHAAEQRHDPLVYRPRGVARRGADLQRPQAAADDRHQVGERASGVDPNEGQESDFVPEPADDFVSVFASALPESDLALPSDLLSEEPEPPLVSSFLPLPPPLPLRA